ncbi:MAG: hypothetical protein PHH84_03140 [Oscillospiraceae bacterium]|nr:hypothetical protein [Oscillospiraceae bacterium]MDD4413205.1 hypothetical protein [Oscillospiraceae bacterium]
MKFFIPAANDVEQANNVYLAIKEFAKDNTSWSIEDDRIYCLKYRHSGKDYYAIVGEHENRTGDLVLAILKSNTYLICTINRGGVRGEPILVGYNEATYIEYFE